MKPCCFSRSHHGILIVIACASLLTGCKPSSTGILDLKSTHVATVSGLYAQFQAMHRGKFPKNEAEFKEYINSQSKGTLESMGLATADELLRSERDGQPITVLYGNHGMTPDFIEVIGHEQVGVNGKQLVAFRGGGYEEFDAERFAAIKPMKN